MFAGLIILEIPYFLLTDFFSSMTTRSYFLSGFTLGVLFASAKSRLFASLLSLTCPSKGNKLPRGAKFQIGNPNATAFNISLDKICYSLASENKFLPGYLSPSIPSPAVELTQLSSFPAVLVSADICLVTPCFPLCSFLSSSLLCLLTIILQNPIEKGSCAALRPCQCEP